MLKSLVADSKKLVFPPDDLVSASLRFTKVLYAQLVTQNLDPPAGWKKLFTQAEADSDSSDELIQKKLAQLSLGMKVTLGFELLVSTAGAKGSPVADAWALFSEDLSKRGDLPTDDDIKAWPQVDRQDDESWMNINYLDFERELEGRRGGTAAHQAPDGGFGDSNTQADLRKIVSRFEASLNDDTAGAEGAEIDEMDQDDLDDDEDLDDDSEDEDKEVSFDEEQFARLMREMMGIPSDSRGQDQGNEKSGTFPTREGHMEDEDVRELTAQMESELASYGALSLDPTPKKSRLSPTGGV